MNVLLLAPQPFFQLRGTPIAVRRVIQVLGKAGHSIDLLTFHEGEDVCLDGCTIHRILQLPWMNDIPPGFSVRKAVCDVLLFFKALRLCREKRFDIVHAVEESVFIARVLKLLLQIPYLYDMDSSLPEQLHDRFPWLGPFLLPLRWLEGVAIRQSYGVVAVCQALEDVVHQQAPSTQVVRMEDVSPHAIPTHSHQCVQSIPDSTHPIILYVGNLQSYQGIDLLLRSFEIAIRQIPSATLVIVGGSPAELRKYHHTMIELKIASQVKFLGPKPLESIPQFLQAADIVVSPRTQGSNTPMKVYSYMESGKTLVATRLKTHTQVLDETMCWLAEPKPFAFAGAIVDAWRDWECSQRKASRARRYAEEQFSAEVQDEKLVLFYEDVEERIRRENGRNTPSVIVSCSQVRERTEVLP